jgi:uncharacterized protein with ParB-like and HNH nuclease domain/predicted transport protein
MNAGTTSLLDLIKNTPRFVVPIFQRAYAWREEECSTLLEDILHIGREEYDRQHFVGSVVYVAPEAGLSSQQAPRLLIDGQQRVATLSILLLALANVLGSDREVGDFSAQKIRAYWLLNELEKGDSHYKLLLSSTDRDTLKAIVKGHPVPVDASKQVIGNLRYFETRLKSSGIDLEHVCRGIRRLVVVEISLSTSDDNPQLIFESLNSKGRDLSQSDLIRNYVLMRQDKSTQDELYMNYWLPLERLFREAPDENTFDEFIRHFLTLRTRELLPRSDTYNLFRRHVEGPEFRATPSVQLLDELLRYARHYATITNVATIGTLSSKLRTALDDFQSLRANVILPFLLEIHNDYAENRIDEQSYLKVLAIIETFLVRRFICGLPTNKLREIFARLLGRLSKPDIADKLLIALLRLSGESRMPRDDEFQRDLSTKPVYKVRWWAELMLRRLEEYDNGEPPDFTKLTIEHVMPQTLSDEWVQSLGEFSDELYKQKLHTLGNLTFTGYNTLLSNSLFQVKRDVPEKGLGNSQLRLNKFFANINEWNFESIQQRADLLAKSALKVWPIPHISYAVDPERTIDTLPNMDVPHIRELIEVLDNRILSEYSEVERRINQSTIVYAASLNVAKMHPRQKWVLIDLYMELSALDESLLTPVGKVRIGAYGNGKIWITYYSNDDIDYVMNVIGAVIRSKRTTT